jgi:hypothetical protein
VADRIFKYELQMEQRQMLRVPHESELLSVAVINEMPVIFVLTHVWDEAVTSETRIIRIARTGEVFSAVGTAYIGTLVFDIGHTFHVFEQRQGVGVPDPLESRFKGDYAEVREATRGT